MSLVSNDAAIDYPESDGRPMGETDWHIEWTLRLRDMLKLRYRGQKVYVASDLLIYYHEGVPRDFVVPDGFTRLAFPHGFFAGFRVDTLVLAVIQEHDDLIGGASVAFAGNPRFVNDLTHTHFLVFELHALIILRRGCRRLGNHHHVGQSRGCNCSQE